MKINAYAKLNLTLDVLSKREDGYHNIDSVMQSIALCDTVTVIKNESVVLKCDLDEISNEKNIAYKAAKSFFDYTNIPSGAVIGIEKNIPVLAGLGGGSADAAAVINALNVLYKTNLRSEELIEIGVAVGADVPFCLFGGTARVTGIGEKVCHLNHLTGYGIIILKTAEKGSTGEMYDRLDGIEFRTAKTEDFIKEMNTDLKFKNVGNDFLYVSPEEDTVQVLKSLSPLCASLSGSGPSCFAIFKDIAEAEKAADILLNKGYDPIVTSFI